MDNDNSVAYIYSRKLVDECNKITQIHNRVSNFNFLEIVAYFFCLKG